MRFRSIFKRIFQGPTIHQLVCYRLTKDFADSIKKNMDGNEAESLQAEISIEELNIQNCDKVMNIREINIKYAFETMVKDSVIILAKWKGEVAGHAVLKPAGIKGCCNNFWERKNYIHYCYVAPMYRGKGIYPYMLTYLVQKAFMLQMGDVIYINADRKNNSSIRGMQKAGFRYWGILKEYGWGGIIFFRRFK